MSEPWTHHHTLINGFKMHYVIAGSGSPVVLVHGWPQSWYEWRKIIPTLAEKHTVIAVDLRGLGDSGRPDTGYDKRTLADDVYQLVNKLGYSKIGLVGHDWGGAVSYYLSYDHPEMVERLMILDMIPGLGRAGEPMPVEMATKFWHVFFHGGNPDLAAKLVAHDVRGYLTYFYRSTVYNYSPAVFTTEDIDEYVRVYSAPGALKAGFQLYSTGIREDMVNLAACTEKLKMPVLAWAGNLLQDYMMPAWQQVADNVEGGVVPECGHFIAEEKPQFAIDEALKFFAPLND
jgi:pimeloyl-ACP methyl ester carboxylesterase